MREFFIGGCPQCFFEMAKANGLKPDEYYRYILERLPYAEAVEGLKVLLLWNVKAALEKNLD
jgi:hypothetical protein